MSVTKNALRLKKYRQTNWFAHICSRFKYKASTRGFDFDLTPESLETLWCQECPVCSVEMKQHDSRLCSDSASLDRFDNNLGYTLGNVNFICWQCNNVKRHCTVEQLKVIADGFQRLQERRRNV